MSLATGGNTFQILNRFGTGAFFYTEKNDFPYIKNSVDISIYMYINIFFQIWKFLFIKKKLQKFKYIEMSMLFSIIYKQFSLKKEHSIFEERGLNLNHLGRVEQIKIRFL